MEKEKKDLTEEQMEVLYKVANFIEEKDLCSELRRTPQGPFLILSDVEECKIIEAFVNDELGLEELPCESGYADSYSVCDNCGKVFCTIPNHAFWKQTWLKVNDCYDYCDDCVDIDMMVEEINHKYNRSDTILTEKDYLDAGFKNYCKEKYGVEYVEETKMDYETIMEEVSNYEYAIFLLESATPFECDIKLFVK